MSQICDGSRNLNLLFTLPGILFLWLFSQPLPFHHKILPPQITTLSPYSKLYPIPPSPWEHTCHLVLFPPHHYSLSKNKSYLLLFLPPHTHTHPAPCDTGFTEAHFQVHAFLLDQQNHFTVWCNWHLRMNEWVTTHSSWIRRHFWAVSSVASIHISDSWDKAILIAGP